LRTVLISWIAAPDRSKLRRHGLEVDHRHAFGGKRQQRRAAARNEREQAIVRPEAADAFEDLARGLLAASSGIGCDASITRRRVVGSPCS
jgi:hypothetical protein